jgi:hypothetical protein
MQKDPFATLGVSENVTQEELYAAYRDLRNTYGDKRFEPGEVGARACEKLDEIEAAYREAENRLKNRYDVSSAQNAYKAVEDCIRANLLDDAQRELDIIQRRDGEWHYFQSMIFFRKKWYAEARSQLVAATQADPYNEKYKDALKNLTDKMNGGNGGARQNRDNFYDDRNQGERSYREQGGRQRSGSGCTPCDCCAGLCAADCCCSCMDGMACC